MSGTYHVKDFGALPGTSCGAAIQAAINTAGADLGSTLIFDSGEYRTDQQLIQPYHALRMVGRGMGWGGQAANVYLTRGATVIKATAAMPQLFRMQPPADPVNGLRLANSGIYGICFDANLLADFAFVMKSTVDCEVDQVGVIKPLLYGMWFGIVPDGDLPKTGVGGATYTEPRDMQHNHFGKIFTDTRANGAHGFYTHGDDLANFSFNDFRDVTYWHKNGFGFYHDHGDTNTYGKITGYRQPGGAGIGFGFGAGVSVADYARANRISYSQFGPGGCYSYGGALPAINNRIDGYSTENGTPLPVVGSGSTLTWTLV